MDPDPKLVWWAPDNEQMNNLDNIKFWKGKEFGKGLKLRAKASNPFKIMLSMLLYFGWNASNIS